MLTKEQIVKELTKLAINDKGLVDIESLEEWLYNTQQYRGTLIHVERVKLEENLKLLTDKYKEAGHAEYRSYRYKLILDKDNEKRFADSVKLKDAFLEFHMILAGPDKVTNGAIMSIYYW